MIKGIDKCIYILYDLTVKKSETIIVRLTAEEKMTAEKAAKATNKTVSELIRFLLLAFALKVNKSNAVIQRRS
jgi:uncharacterized protein (DUF1778 family)